MAFWIFKCNPEKYRFAERLANRYPTISCLVSRHREEIAPGDTVFFLETGRNRGIRAVMRIEQGPQLMPELEAEQPYWIEPDTEVRWRVVGQLTKWPVNLPHTTLREVPGLENLSVFRQDVFQQTTNFPVTDAEGTILMSLVEGCCT
jgi:hypothetical protein